MIEELCPACSGNGCSSCDHSGRIDHGTSSIVHEELPQYISNNSY